MIKRWQQRGLSMVEFMFWGIAIVIVALVAMKLVPAYMEYLTVKKILADIGSEVGTKSMSNAEIRDRFARRAMIDNISSVAPGDLKISRDNNRTVVSVEYTFQTPLVGNVSLLADFSASSSGRDSQAAD
jgi:cell division protein FtsL